MKKQSEKEIGDSDNDKMVLNINAVKKGKNEIGPLNFTINGIACTTNKITYDVIDPLPNVDEGLWFRKVNTSDSTFCIIIEQRIPASDKKNITSENSFRLTTEPETYKIAKLKDAYTIAGLSGLRASSSTNFGSIYDKNNNQKQFMSGYSVYYFTILDKTIKIKATKDQFENLPNRYKFEDIVIQ